MAEKKIDGVVYRYDRLPASESLPLLLRILKLLGPAEAIFAASVEDDAEIIQAISRFLKDMDEKAIQSFITEMVQHCRADGEPCVVGVKPQYLDECLKVALFALQTEFRDFFGGSQASGDLAGIAKTMFASARAS